MWVFEKINGSYSWTLLGGVTGVYNLEKQNENKTNWPFGRYLGALWSSGSTLWLTGGVGFDGTLSRSRLIHKLSEISSKLSAL